MITVCGELVADLIEQPDGTLLPVPGGSPANTALACARLGRPVQFLGRFGADVFGERARQRLLDAGVGLTGSVRAAEPSTLAVATPDDEGHAHYSFWTQGTADWQWTPAELAAAPQAGTRVVHTGSVASWTPPGAEAIVDLLERSRDVAGTLVSYDPNVRPALLRPESAALVRRVVATATVVKVSDEDLRVLVPDAHPLEAARGWLSWGPAAVVVTAGARGASVVRADASPVSVGAPAVAVVDTIGAGDTFTAGLLHALLDLVPAGTDAWAGVAALDDEAWRAALRTAATAAGITCTRAGCHPPTAEELGSALQGAGPH